MSAWHRRLSPRFFWVEGASVNRLEAPLYHFKTDHDTASKIAHKIFIISNERLDTINAMCSTYDIAELEAEPKFTNFIPKK